MIFCDAPAKPRTEPRGRSVCRWLGLIVGMLALIPPAICAVPVARGARHALLVAVGNYAGLPRLAGAQRDLDRVRAVAKAAGVPDQNVITLHDGGAGADNIRSALTDLALRLAPADRVFIYFSGLGSRRHDPDRPGGCEEVFIAADKEAIGYGELAGLIIPVAERAEKTAVFFDTCGTAWRDGGLTARCVPAEAGGDCRVTANTRWRNLVADVRKAGVPTANIVSMHAGKPDEAVFEDAGGGLFTTGLDHCSFGEMSDRDESGAVSLAELAACAQHAVDRRIGTGKGGRITLHGNQGFVPFIHKGGGQGAVGKLFEDLVGGRDGRKEMVLENVRSPAGGNGPAVSLRSSAVGYLYLFAADANGTARLLYPATGDGSNRIRAGETFIFSQESGHSPLAAGATVLAILADNERDLAMLPAAPKMAFVADTVARKAIYDFVTTSVRATEAPCQATGHMRNLSLWRGCSDAYGAAAVVIVPK